jgi:hypothetical protein
MFDIPLTYLSPCLQFAAERRPLDLKCTEDDFKAAVIYTHCIAMQDAAHEGAIVPAWFWPAIWQTLPVSYELIFSSCLFTLLQHGLLPLRILQSIDNLNDQSLTDSLQICSR